MDEARFIDLETRIAYQDDLLDTLNDIVAAQQRRIDQLEKAYGNLVEHVRDLSATMIKGPAGTEHEIPPHY